MADTGCICVPCTNPGRGSWPGAPGWPHCAACCYGSMVAEFDHDCPVGDHAETALLQWGPKSTVEVAG